MDLELESQSHQTELTTIRTTLLLDNKPSTRRFRISEANIGPNLCHQNRTSIITARWMVAGLVLSHLNGLSLVMGGR